MRLKKIKLAGFKSFVDPTSVEFNSDLVGIVGPNGCGKSNVIDAVRWVMGEISAKQLRSESMTDVIFNGSSARAPVGQASVELIFDNSDASLGGEYAAFSEIAIKRLVTRDAQSTYFLNNTRCRRRDITDIFLGTGLGPRSYAIIEQGMISRLIEAKPEDLRVFLEETAGISKYKERRRETENRIRHTQENLDRLSDLRGELSKQINRLERQAEAAEKYKTFKTELRQISAQHLALKWRDFDEGLQAKQRELAEYENGVEKQIAELREIDAAIESQRVGVDESQQGLQQAQSDYYQTGAVVAKCEQALEHQRERQAQLDMDIAELNESLAELQASYADDEQQYSALQTQINSLNPQEQQLAEQYKTSFQAQDAAEQAMQAWQQNWQQYTQQLAQYKEQHEVAETKVVHLQDNISQTSQRTQLLEDTLTELRQSNIAHTLSAMQAQCDESADTLTTAHNRLLGLSKQLQSQQQENEQTQQDLDQTREQLQTVQNEQVSLRALQDAAFGRQDDVTQSWLQAQSLSHKQRLAEQLVVEPQWMCAVETVLGDYLQAICIDSFDALNDSLANFTQGTLALFEQGEHTNTAQAGSVQNTLLSKIQSKTPVDQLLSGVYCADSLSQALAMRQQLAAHESVVTPEGIWLSKQWLRVTRSVDEQEGILAREQRLQDLQPKVDALADRLQQLQTTLQTGKTTLQNLTEERSQAQTDYNQQARVDADLQAEHRALVVKEQEVQQQTEKVEHELQLLQDNLQRYQTDLAAQSHTQSEAQMGLSELEQQGEQLSAERRACETQLQTAKSQAQQDQQHHNQLNLQLTGMSNRAGAIENALQRVKSQLDKYTQRQTQLTNARAQASEPIQSLQEELDTAIEKRVEDEQALQTARQQVDSLAHALRQKEQARHQCEERVNTLRSELEAFRLDEQTVRVKRDGVAEQMQEMDVALQPTLDALPAEANLAEWEQKETKLENQIKRLGAINLAAIDEYAEHVERLQYLDKQNDDLIDALETLQTAIGKIDKETRHRFKETFDAANKNLSELFVQVFGGGSAHLELTDSQDLLNTGVTIMAQPPGKRNSSIHALSGGEKALTALSLVFSLFKLTPAPFCMLDEVDAPLDDANVERFARLVKEMAEQIQFIVITHNKGTMEIAHHLMGVTMKEAGVSRLVSVDVDKASELAVA